MVYISGQTFNKIFNLTYITKTNFFVKNYYF